MPVWSRQRTQSSQVLGAVALASCCLLLTSAFVTPAWRREQPVRERALTARFATGEYTGFVPDMQRRTLMNLVLVGASLIPVGILGGGYLLAFIPTSGGGGGGATPCGDINGAPISLESWVKNHKPNDRDLVQGLKGEAHYLISTDAGIKDFAILAVCTHLGCVVPWNRAANKFICPCHGSQYDENGKVVRGPAPLSLALAHTSVVNGNVAVSPWTEQDFRTGLDPWWK